MHTDTHPQGTTDGPNVATLSLTEAARLLRVHPATVRRWIDGGRLPAYQAFKGGAYRLARVEVELLLTERKAA